MSAEFIDSEHSRRKESDPATFALLRENKLHKNATRDRMWVAGGTGEEKRERWG